MFFRSTHPLRTMAIINQRDVGSIDLHKQPNELWSDDTGSQHRI
jgi:hypothetical protein